jgi:hypothetical protein
MISLARSLPSIRIVNVAQGEHPDAQKACHLGNVG